MTTDRDHRPAGGADLTWAGTLFGAAVALAGMAAAVVAALLFGTVTPDAFAHGGGIGPAMGPILLATQAMQAAPSGKARHIRWLLASLPVAAASTLGAGLAGIAGDAVFPAEWTRSAGFICRLIGGGLVAIPAVVLVLRCIGPEPESGLNGKDSKDGKP